MFRQTAPPFHAGFEVIIHQAFECKLGSILTSFPVVTLHFVQFLPERPIVQTSLRGVPYSIIMGGGCGNCYNIACRTGEASKIVKIVILGTKNAITRRKSMGTDLCIARNDGVMSVQGVGGVWWHGCGSY